MKLKKFLTSLLVILSSFCSVCYDDVYMPGIFNPPIEKGIPDGLLAILAIIFILIVLVSLILIVLKIKKNKSKNGGNKNKE